MDVVIPAAGLGSRFLPASRSVPKELLPLGVKPLIQHALEEAERAGFAKAVVVLSAGKGAVRSYFQPDPALERVLGERGDVSRLALVRDVQRIARRLRLRFMEQPAPLGLGEAVLRCRQLCGENFAVLLPDDVVPTAAHWTDLLEVHRRTGGACFCVRPVPLRDAGRFGIAGCEAMAGFLRVRALQEKPGPGETSSDLAIFGRYIVTTPVLEALARSQDSVAELQLTAGLAGALDEPPGVFAVPFAGDFFDCGTPEDYALSAARYAATSGVTHPA